MGVVPKAQEDHKVVFLVEYLNVDNVRKRRYSPTDIVDWLLKADFHFIIVHMHQGVISKQTPPDETLRWTADTLRSELWRLRDHPGFPSG